VAGVVVVVVGLVDEWQAIPDNIATRKPNRRRRILDAHANATPTHSSDE